MNAREKGRKGEIEAAKAWTAAGLGHAFRGQQHDGTEGRDVKCALPGVHLESKRTEQLSLYPAVEQAVRDAAEGDIPIVLHRRSRKPWLAVVRLEDLLPLARRIVAYCGEEPSDGC